MDLMALRETGRCQAVLLAFMGCIIRVVCVQRQPERGTELPRLRRHHGRVEGQKTVSKCSIAPCFVCEAWDAGEQSGALLRRKCAADEPL